MLFQFSELFAYDEPNDRAIAIVGAAFLDKLLEETLRNFLIDDEREVHKLLQSEGHLGTLGSRISLAYCLGLVNDVVKSDLRLVAKIRNAFAHDITATFSDERIKSLCASLRWHREAMLREPPEEATPRDYFQVGVNQLVGYLNALPSVALGKRCVKSPWHEAAKT
jgi:hypothetical protein